MNPLISSTRMWWECWVLLTLVFMTIRVENLSFCADYPEAVKSCITETCLIWLNIQVKKFFWSFNIFVFYRPRAFQIVSYQQIRSEGALMIYDSDIVTLIKSNPSKSNDSRMFSLVNVHLRVMMCHTKQDGGVSLRMKYAIMKKSSTSWKHRHRY